MSLSLLSTDACSYTTASNSLPASSCANVYTRGVFRAFLTTGSRSSKCFVSNDLTPVSSERVHVKPPLNQFQAQSRTAELQMTPRNKWIKPWCECPDWNVLRRRPRSSLSLWHYIKLCLLSHWHLRAHRCLEKGHWSPFLLHVQSILFSVFRCVTDQCSREITQRVQLMLLSTFWS